MARSYRVVVRLGQIMRERRIKPEELARQCGVDRTYISKLATQRRYPSLDVLARICVALDLPIQELVSIVPVEGDAPALTRPA